LSPSTGAPGTPVQATVAGFQASELVVFRLAGGGLTAPITLGTVRASASGGAALNFVIPANTPTLSSYTMIVVGNTSGLIGAAPFGITFITNAVFTPVNTLTLTGFGFGSPGIGSRATEQFRVELSGAQVAPDAAVTSWSDTQIVLSPPASASSGVVRVFNGGAASNAFCARLTVGAGGCLAAFPEFGLRPAFPIAVTGSGFAIGEQLSITWDSNTGASLGTVTVAADGGFSTTVATPTDLTAATGPHDLFAVATVSSLPATRASTRVLLAPALSCVVPNTGANPTAVTLSGRNFGAAQSIGLVQFSGVGGTLLTAAVTSWSDTSVAVTVPVNAVTGPVSVTQAGARSNGLIFAAGLAPTMPSITCVTPSVGTTGTSVQIDGFAFGADPGLANRSSNAANVRFGAVQADVSDFVSWSPTRIVLTAPANLVDGMVRVTAGGVASTQVPFELAYTVTGTPTVAANLTGGSPGTAIVVNGVGFSVGQGVSLVFDSMSGSPANLGFATVLADGTFATPQPPLAVAVPAIAPGAHTLDAVVNAVRVASTPFRVTTLTLSASSGAAGSNIAASGAGYQPGTFVELRWDSSIGTLLVTALVSGGGTFAAGFSIPTNANLGPHAVVAGNSTAPFNVNSTVCCGGGLANGLAVDFTMTSNPPAGGPGAMVTISGGTDLGANEPVIVIWDSQAPPLVTTPASPMSNGAGVFGGFSFLVPANATAGTHTVSVFGTTTGFGRGKTFTVGQVASISLSQTTLAAGAQVTVSGVNFQTGTVNLVWDDAGNTALANGVAVVSGGFTAVVTVPTTATAGAHLLSANQGGGTLAQASLTVTVPQITLSLATGPVGAAFLVTGSGFTASQTVTISWDDAPPTTATGTSDVNGALPAVNFTVPTGAAAVAHTVRATQGNSSATA
ncbi:MAG: IPT/TIG domain-containing protein, partial [Chloroflexi bacterium]|nr:IPT/TIG domain-containing protein [Chloroflexota bacterium]